MNIQELKNRIRFGLSELSADNGHHEFEHIARQFSRQRICRNILAATGPVSAGGDGGIDFETYKIEGVDTQSFALFLESRKIIFACTTTQGDNLYTKIKGDIKKIASNFPDVDTVYYFCTENVPIGKVNDIKEWCSKNYEGIEFEIFDRNRLADELTEFDLRYIAIDYLHLPQDIYNAGSSLPYKMIKTFLEKIGKKNIPVQEYEKTFAGLVEEYNSLIQKFKNMSEEEPKIAELRSEALQLIEKAEFDEALVKLSEAEAIDLKAIEAHDNAIKVKKESLSNSIIYEADIEKMRLNYLDAEKHYDRALQYTSLPEKRFHCINSQAECLSKHGSTYGHVASLEKSALILQEALTEFTKGQFPLNWAKLNKNLGTILKILGSRSGDSVLLKKAIDHGKAALEIFTQEDYPEELGDIQNNLGIFCLSYAELTNDFIYFKDSKKHFKYSIKQRAFDKFPNKWAEIMNNLGVLYKVWGERLIWDEAGNMRSEIFRVKGEQLLHQGIDSYEDAVKIRSKEKDPFIWAQTNMNLANLHFCLGDATRNVNYLHESIKYHKEALSVYTKEKYPVEWASEKNNLAVSLYKLGRLKNNPAYLEDTINLCEESLSVRAREIMPRYCAETKINICYALESLGDITKQKGYFQRALNVLAEVYDIEFSQLKRANQLASLESIKLDLLTKLSQCEEA